MEQESPSAAHKQWGTQRGERVVSASISCNNFCTSSAGERLVSVSWEAGQCGYDHCAFRKSSHGAGDNCGGCYLRLHCKDTWEVLGNRRETGRITEQPDSCYQLLGCFLAKQGFEGRKEGWQWGEENAGNKRWGQWSFEQLFAPTLSKSVEMSRARQCMWRLDVRGRGAAQRTWQGPGKKHWLRKTEELARCLTHTERSRWKPKPNQGLIGLRDMIVVAMKKRLRGRSIVGKRIRVFFQGYRAITFG